MNPYDILITKALTGGGTEPQGHIEITNTEVTNVASYATAQVVDSNLAAENIKKDVDILGVTGTFEGGEDHTIEDAILTGELIGEYENDRVSYLTYGVLGSMDEYLTKISLPNCEYTYGENFCSCYSLMEINLPKLKELGPGSLSWDDSLTEIVLPECVHISDGCCMGCGVLTTISLPKCTCIDATDFGYECPSLTHLSLPSLSGDNEYIVYYALPHIDNLEYLDLSSYDTAITESLFSGHESLKTIKLASCPKIEREAFSGCTSLSTITLDSCERIEREAFSGCTSLEKIELYGDVSVVNQAFKDCSNLTSLYLYSDTVCLNVVEGAFEGTPIDNFEGTGLVGKIYVPGDLVEEYKAEPYFWAQYADRIFEIPPTDPIY